MILTSSSSQLCTISQLERALPPGAVHLMQGPEAKALECLHTLKGKNLETKETDGRRKVISQLSRVIFLSSENQNINTAYFTGSAAAFSMARAKRTCTLLQRASCLRRLGQQQLLAARQLKKKSYLNSDHPHAQYTDTSSQSQPLCKQRSKDRALPSAFTPSRVKRNIHIK